MAEVIVTEDVATGLTTIELWKGSRKLKDMRLSKGELQDLREKICPRRTNPGLDEALNEGDGVYRP